MRKQAPKKLLLSRESVRQLQTADLDKLAGGMIPVISIDEPTCVGHRCYTGR